MENNSRYNRVDPKHPFLGLNNAVCKNPKHYCCTHNVWLSEEDARKRRCRKKPDGTRCRFFKENHYNAKNLDALIRKTRPTKNKGNKRYYG